MIANLHAFTSPPLFLAVIRLIIAAKGAGTVTLAAVTDHFQSLYVGVVGGPGLRDSEMLIPTKTFLQAAAVSFSTCFNSILA